MQKMGCAEEMPAKNQTFLQICASPFSPSHSKWLLQKTMASLGQQLFDMKSSGPYKHCHILSVPCCVFTHWHRSGRGGFPKWQGPNSELLSFAPLASPEGFVTVSSIQMHLMLIPGVQWRETVLLIYKICTIYSSISSLPEQIPPL